MTEIINLKYCSFCGRGESATDYIVAGRIACICEECVKQCIGLIAKRRKEVIAKRRKEKEPTIEECNQFQGYTVPGKGLK